MRDLSTAQRGSESGNRPIGQLFGAYDRTAPGSDELLKDLGSLDRPVDGTFGIHEQEGSGERSDEARRCSVQGVAIFGSFRSHRISMMSFARIQGIRTNINFPSGKGWFRSADGCSGDATSGSSRPRRSSSELRSRRPSVRLLFGAPLLERVRRPSPGV